MHRPTFLHIRNMSNIDITYCKTQPINICLYCDLCRTLYYRRGFFCNLGTYNRAPYTLQANYSLPACLFFTQNRRMFHPCLSPFESLFFSNKPLRCPPKQADRKAKKCAPVRREKTMRAKDWTMVVASESHMSFIISAPIHFATRRQFFPAILRGSPPGFCPAKKLSKPWFFLIHFILVLLH